MDHLKLVYSKKAMELLHPETERTIMGTDGADLIHAAAVVVTGEEAGFLDRPEIRAFGIPTFLVLADGENRDEAVSKKADHIIDMSTEEAGASDRQVEEAAEKYEQGLVPPFFKALRDYIAQDNNEMATPGHHSGQFFCAHPAGRVLYDFYGENIFKSDFSSSDIYIGNLLIHEGPPVEAEKHASGVFHADKTYFVLNGTSSANKIVLNAVLAPGDIVLYDRNNHKSVSQGALVQADALPIYLETARNPFGSIGGILSKCFEEKYIRALIAEKDPERAKAKRPIRLAVIQLGTYDGCIYNAGRVIKKIGHLCDYILFDSAWVGYEQFIPMMKDCSPLLLELGPKDPGIFVTQSVHKQQAGFSQASYIHKKDRHIKGQERYVPHKRVNNAFLLHATTSPFYPIFATLDVNARMHEGEGGKYMWMNTVRNAIELRKDILRRCKHFRPLLPPIVHGKKWEDGDTEEMAGDMAYWAFEPGASWHSFKGYGKDQYFIDPCKLQLVTPGINVKTGNYQRFGIHASILFNYLCDHGIIPEKCDLNTILFLLTPGESREELVDLVDKLVAFERLIDEDAMVKDVIPGIYHQFEGKYEGYHIQRLCREMHNFYRERKVSELQRRLFLHDYLPEYVMTPHDANTELVRGHGELVRLDKAEGRVALEGALPYPPGILCQQPGERWSESAVRYFLALEEGINQLPGFDPEIQGVYLEKEADGLTRAYGYVLKEEYDPK